MVSMALEKEIATYDRELPSLLPNEGKYVLIHGDEVVDLFDSYDDALKAGYEKFDLNPFLVRQIKAIAQIQYFTRDIVCPT